jgi:hypothetical protein
MVNMTTAVNDLLNAFDALEPAEQQRVAVEILRRSAATDELTTETFDELAAELFLGYDAEESSCA